MDVLSKRASKSPFDKFIKDIVSGKIATEIYKQAKKVHPVQNVDVWKSRVVNLPTIKLEDEEKPELKPEDEEKTEEKPTEEKVEEKPVEAES